MEDTDKAKRLVELTKGSSKVLVTLFENGQMTSCVEEGEAKNCETYQGDEKLCDEYVEHLKSEGYQATEVVPGGPASGDSLPQFLAGRESPPQAEPAPAPEEAVPATMEEPPAEQPESQETVPAEPEETPDEEPEETVPAEPEETPLEEEELDATPESDEPEEIGEDVDDDARE